MKNISKEELSANKEYLLLLSEKYPNIQSVRAKIINLKSTLNLPKGTEHFITDIHGENESFEHILRNCSGSIKRKVMETLSDREDKETLQTLITLIYYPVPKINLLKEEGVTTQEWYKNTIVNLLDVCRVVSAKYTRKKLREALHPYYKDIIDELLHHYEDEKRGNYYNGIIDAIIETDASEDFIIALCRSIRQLNLDHLHIIGDIFDRGKGPHYVLDLLSTYHSLDIQWGNHDALWMGAAAGDEACIANAIRICLRYGNTSILEEGYGINLLPLTFLAQNVYKDETDLDTFMPRLSDEIPDIDEILMAKMHKAITIIQFKIESKVIKRHPNYRLDDRDLINKCDFEKGEININGKVYKLNSRDFPTIDPKTPSKLTEEEEKVIKSLKNSFKISEKLQKHARLLFSKGSIYTVHNGNLMFHASIPMNNDGSFKKVRINEDYYSGKKLLDVMDEKARNAYFDKDTDTSFFWFLWLSPVSPLFGKDKMATFERYFIDEPETHKENYLPYFTLSKKKETAVKILEEFGLTSEQSVIINGHVPVEIQKGQNPIQADGKLLIIDGGYSKPYQKVTGVAGVTLTFNSYGMNLVVHKPFESVEKAITEGLDIESEFRFVSAAKNRVLIKDTKIGEKIKKEIYYLELLLKAYQIGEIKIPE